MDYQQATVLIVVVLLVGLALYFTVTMEEADNAIIDNNEAKNILLNSMDRGWNIGNYTYHYAETVDGYETEYALASDGEQKMITIKTPLSEKQVYFLQNDTILCIEFNGESVCSSVKNNARMKNYLQSLKVKFFSNSRIEKNVRDLNYLINNGYLAVDPNISKKNIEGVKCNEITYTINYGNISLADAARFGIGSNSPKIFDWALCAENDTGHAYRKEFRYNDMGMEHDYRYQFKSLEESANISEPQNTTVGAVVLLEKERQKQVELVKCYTTKENEEKERCISNVALRLKNADLCEYCGDRRDRCLVSMVPLTKDESICSIIEDPAFIEDCYIELAGAHKNSTYCDSIVDEEKKEFCLNIAKSLETEETEFDIKGFVDYVDKHSSKTLEENDTGE